MKLVNLAQCSRCQGKFAIARQQHGTTISNVLMSPPAKSKAKFLLLGENALCKVCSVPNDLIEAAKQARLKILVGRERRSAMVMGITVAVFSVCMGPVGLAYMVSRE